MKLRNLLFGTMIACAFVACSNDDDPTPDNGNGGNEPVGTSLEVFTKSPVASKADPSNADAINSLTLVVFDASDKIEAIEKSTQGEGGVNSREVALTPGEKSVMMIANYSLPSSIAVGDEYAELAALTNTRVSEDATAGFSMSSKLYTGVTIETNKRTFLGYSAFPTGFSTANAILETEDNNGVKLYRNVAKVVLSSVTITNERGDFKNMSNPNLEIKEVFILNAKATTNLVASAADKGKHWAATQSATTDLLGGVDKGSWGNSDKFMLGASWTTNAIFKSTVVPATIGYSGEGMSKTTEAYAAVPFYVYENGSSTVATEEAKTLLVVKANVTYDGVNESTGEVERKTVTDRYYTLAIGRTGFDTGETTGFTVAAASAVDFPFASRVADPSSTGINGASANKAFDVLRNLQYKIALTVKGLGYDQPGGGDPEQYLDVKVQVVGFGDVDQSVEI